MRLTGLDGIEKVGTLGLLLDICVNEERVSLRMDILHHDLETIKTAGLWNLDLAAESFDEVLIDNSIGGSEEREDVGDEVTLIIIQPVVPVVKILGEINFFCGPEGCLRLLVHLPDLLRLVSRSTLRVACPDATLTSWYLIGKRTKR